MENLTVNFCRQQLDKEKYKGGDLDDNTRKQYFAVLTKKGISIKEWEITQDDIDEFNACFPEKINQKMPSFMTIKELEFESKHIKRGTFHYDLIVYWLERRKAEFAPKNEIATITRKRGNTLTAPRKGSKGEEIIRLFETTNMSGYAIAKKLKTTHSYVYRIFKKYCDLN